jgi:hypothetical protein
LKEKKQQQKYFDACSSFSSCMQTNSLFLDSFKKEKKNEMSVLTFKMRETNKHWND